MSKLNFEFIPNILASTIGPIVYKKYVVFLDFKNELEDDSKIVKISLDVGFNQLKIPKDILVRKDFFIGTSGAEIIINFDKSEIIDFTKGEALDVEYSIESSKSSEQSLKFEPSVKVNDTIEIKLGSYKNKKSTKENLDTKYKSKEYELANLPSLKGIKWDFNMHRGQKSVRDNLLFSLPLFVKVKNESFSIEGNIYVKPLTPTYYNRDKKEVIGQKAVLIQFYLWMTNQQPYNSDGFKINFKQI